MFRFFTLRRRCVALGLALLAAGPVAAQTTVHYVSLPAPPAAPLATTYPFFVEQVLDARPDRSRLGVVRLGLSNALAPADFRAGVPDEVGRFLNARLPARPGATPVLLRVVDLRLGEYVGIDGEHGTAELVAEWYRAGPDGRYRLLQRTEQDVERQSALGDVTSAHGRNIAETLVRSLAAMAPAAGPAEGGGPTFSLAELRQPVVPAPYPIETAAAPQAGVYRSFVEWRQNQPLTPGRLEVETRPYRAADWAKHGLVTPYQLAPEGRREPVPPTDAWGFSDGQRVYVSFWGDYRPLERRGTDYVFFAEGPDGSRYPFLLNVRTGRAMFYGGLDYSAAVAAGAKPTTLLVLYPARAKDAPALTLSAPGQEPRTVEPNGFALFSWPASPPEQPLCAAAPNAPAPACAPLRLTTGLANYFECTPGPTPGSAPALRPLDDRAGAALMKRLMR